VSNTINEDLVKLDATKPDPVGNLPAQDPAGVTIAQGELELHRLWLRFSAALVAMDVGPTHWPLDGWLRLDGDRRPPFPVILVQFNVDGVGVVLGMEHPVPPGRLGDLTTQAHGAGCRNRTVLCQGREAYFRDGTLQYAALRFDPEAWLISAGCGEPGRWGG
jgi:hypothetical protein